MLFGLNWWIYTKKATNNYATRKHPNLCEWEENSDLSISLNVHRKTMYACGIKLIVKCS